MGGEIKSSRQQVGYPLPSQAAQDMQSPHALGPGSNVLADQQRRIRMGQMSVAAPVYLAGPPGSVTNPGAGKQPDGAPPLVAASRTSAASSAGRQPPQQRPKPSPRAASGPGSGAGETDKQVE